MMHDINIVDGHKAKEVEADTWVNGGGYDKTTLYREVVPLFHDIRCFCKLCFSLQRRLILCDIGRKVHG